MTSHKPLIVLGAIDSKAPRFSQLPQWGYDVRSAGNFSEVLRMLDQAEPSVLLLEGELLKEVNGQSAEEIYSRRPQVPVIVLTANMGGPAAHEGLFEAMCPDTSAEQLRSALARAAEKHSLRERIAMLESELDDDAVSRLIVGSSDAMVNVRDNVRALSSSSLHVIIVGETGTGRERIARAIHAAGKRKNKPFVAVHIESIGEPAIERVLFGPEGRSLAASDLEPTGACVSAEGGTLYLSGLTSLALTTQAKLARFLKEATVHGPSGDRVKPLDVRIIIGLDRDPTEERDAGRLQNELLDRLQAPTIHVPALRQRVEDIVPLAMHFLREFASYLGKSFEGFHPSAISKLEANRWPGNVGELRSIIERLASTELGPVIGGEAVGTELQNSRYVNGSTAPSTSTLGVSPIIDLVRTRKMDDIEKQAILYSLQKTRGNVVEAARILGLGPATVYRKIKRYGVRAKTISGS